MENENIHESDTGVQAFEMEFDSTPANEPEPQDTPRAPENPYTAIIEEQKEQIAALMEANKNMSEQITDLINSGAQISHKEEAKETKGYKTLEAGEYAPVYGGGENPLSELNTPALSDDADYSLEGLAADIGKR